MADYIKSTNFAVKDSLTTGNPAKIVKGTEIDVELVNVAAAIASKLDANSPTLTGTPTAPTAATSTNNTQISTTAYVVNRIAQDIAVKANVASPVFTGTITLGTQTNKATINYATDAARTLTIPAVGGNRTFAFLEEAQTFTANQTIGANLVFSGNARRIQGQFAVYDNNSTSFQNSATNATTALNVIPNGTGAASAIHLSSTSNLNDSLQAALQVEDNVATALFCIANGTRAFKELRLVNGGIARIIINPNGEVAIGGGPVSGVRLNVDGPFATTSSVVVPAVYGTTVGGSFRTVYIDNFGQLGGLTSTRESKTDIAAVEDTSWLMNLEPVSFKRRKKDKAGAYTAETYDNTEYGLIADDVVNVRPEICVMANGKLSGINYEQLISPMLKEIQKLRAEVEALKAKG